MDIKLHEITIKDLFEGYIDNQEEGVAGFVVMSALILSCIIPKLFNERV